MTILENLKNLKIGEVLEREPLKNHTTFKIGGPCKALILNNSYEDVRKTVEFLRNNNQKFMIIGNGSNLLVSDKGLDFFVIKIGENLSEVQLEGEKIRAMAGAGLGFVSKFAIKNSLEGMEFSSGIPGNIGGGVSMNAGAYGGELKDIIESVKVINNNNEIINMKNSEMNFSYRHSRVFEEDLIVLEATFKLKHGVYDEIYARFKDFDNRRREKQPLEYPSAGSTFKRPVGYFAGKLIEEAGLRGYRYKNAMVSSKHCGFVITDGESNFDEVMHVINHVRDVVF